jgi:hypothetical protein
MECKFEVSDPKAVLLQVAWTDVVLFIGLDAKDLLVKEAPVYAQGYHVDVGAFIAAKPVIRTFLPMSCIVLRSDDITMIGRVLKVVKMTRTVRLFVLVVSNNATTETGFRSIAELCGKAFEGPVEAGYEDNGEVVSASEAFVPLTFYHCTGDYLRCLVCSVQDTRVSELATRSGGDGSAEWDNGLERLVGHNNWALFSDNTPVIDWANLPLTVPALSDTVSVPADQALLEGDAGLGNVFEVLVKAEEAFDEYLQVYAMNYIIHTPTNGATPTTYFHKMRKWHNSA